MESSNNNNTNNNNTSSKLSFLGKKPEFNPTKTSSKHHSEIPLPFIQRKIQSFNKMWSDSFGRRAIILVAIFASSAYFVAIPKFNTYIKKNQDEEDDDEEDEDDEEETTPKEAINGSKSS